MIVINTAGYPIRITLPNKDFIVPYTGKPVEIPDEAYLGYASMFKVLQPPKSVIETNPNIAPNKPNTISNTLQIDPKGYRFDVLYPFHFNKPKELKQAFKRLTYSIACLINQDVNICICNTSKTCIKTKLDELGEFSYIHKPLTEFCKSKTINLGVKKLIKSEYFIMSDIDLIYHEDYVKSLKKYLFSPRPVRVITTNRNIGYEHYSANIEDFDKYLYVSDPFRTPFGISPGNGLVHRESFLKVGGFDEEFTGYAQEDSDFNDRIKFINRYIEDERKQLTTIHLFHSKGTMSDKNLLTSKNNDKKRIHLLNILSHREFNEKTDLKFLQVNLEKANG